MSSAYVQQVGEDMLESSKELARQQLKSSDDAKKRQPLRWLQMIG